MRRRPVSLIGCPLRSLSIPRRSTRRPRPSSRLCLRRGGLDTSHAKEAFDALGVAVRAGVDPQSALEVLGIPGVKLTGAVPVSLRLPEADSKALEEK